MKKRTKKQKGRWVRRKGHQFERDIANAIRTVFPNARRHLEYQDAEANGVDLVNTEPFKIQCKRLKKYSSITAIGEVTYDELLGEIPVLVTAGDGLRPMAVLPFYDLLHLMKQIHLRREG